jgi:hypothetical protein
MSETTNDVQAQSPDQAKPILTTAEVLQAARENFTLISAATILTGIGLSVIFLTSYLSIFDWHLIWFVQYTDIATFGLLAIGVLAGSLSTFYGFALVVVSEPGEVNWRKFRIPLAIGVLIFLALLFNTIRLGKDYFHLLFGGTSLFTGAWLFVWVVRLVKRQTWPTIGDVIFVVFFAALNAGGLGQWLGFSVKETDTFGERQGAVCGADWRHPEVSDGRQECQTDGRSYGVRAIALQFPQSPERQ